MFWGLIMEPNKRYTQTVERPFHVSMATLDISTSDDEPVQVMLCYEGRNYLLCNLSKKQTCQATLDLNFQENTKISFTSNGSGHVHLTGYLIPEDDMDDLDEMDEMEDEEEEDEEEVPQLVGKQLKRKATDKNDKRTMKKLKALADCISQNGQDDSSDSDNVIEEEGEEEEDDDEEEGGMELDFEDDDDDDDEDEDVDDEEVDDEEEEEDDDEEEEEEEEKVEEVKPKGKQNQQQQKNQKQQKDAKDKAVVVNGKDTNQQKKNKKEQQQQDKQAKSTQEVKPEVKQQVPKKQVLSGGIVIEELKVGTGAPAIKNKFVSVYYVGKLKNGKKFDATQSGKGFKFRLGGGEVIKGWDVGLIGMKVGGKRRITVPPAMGYGKKGSPPVIPGNSVLVFDVELKEVH